MNEIDMRFQVVLDRLTIIERRIEKLEECSTIERIAVSKYVVWLMDYLNVHLHCEPAKALLVKKGSPERGP